jgi:HlyD family secretion protein
MVNKAGFPKQWQALGQRLMGARGVMLGVLLGMGLALGVGRLLSPAASGDQDTSKPASETQPADGSVNAAAQTVTVEQPKPAAISQTLTGTGTVQANDLLQVIPQASGLRIEEVRVREGDAVAAGQIVAVLDDQVLQARLLEAEANLAQSQALVQQQIAAKQQAEANLSQAEENFQRYQALFDRGAISEQELTSRRTQAITAREGVTVAIANITSAEATVTSRQAEIDQLQTQQNQTLVIAPASGIIAERKANLGDMSSTSNPIYTLIQDNQLELAVKVPQSQLSQIILGSPVTITSTSDPNLALEGSIRSIDPLVNEQTREATVKIALPANPKLRPGLFLSANIVTGKRQGLAIPREAIVTQADGSSVVYVLEAGNKVRQQVVEVGGAIRNSNQARANSASTPRIEPSNNPSNNPSTSNIADINQVEILSGLSANVQIVVKGAAYLQDGDVVKVVEQ